MKTLFILLCVLVLVFALEPQTYGETVVQVSDCNTGEEYMEENGIIKLKLKEKAGERGTWLCFKVGVDGNPHFKVTDQVWAGRSWLDFEGLHEIPSFLEQEESSLEPYHQKRYSIRPGEYDQLTLVISGYDYRTRQETFTTKQLVIENYNFQ